jgi:hypothetical protein
MGTKEKRSPQVIARQSFAATVNDPSGEDRIRTPPENAAVTGDSAPSGAESGAIEAREAILDPELTAVIDAWPVLPEAIRAGILAMIRAAG